MSAQQTESKPERDTSASTKTEWWRSMPMAAVMGVLVLAGFAAFVVYMLRNITDGETEWQRAMVLFGGVEAVAFAAAGYFFGTQVQRGKVEDAKKDAESASTVANAQKDARDQFAMRVIDDVERERTRARRGGTLSSGGQPDSSAAWSAEETHAGLVEAARALLRS